MCKSYPICKKNKKPKTKCLNNVIAFYDRVTYYRCKIPGFCGKICQIKTRIEKGLIDSKSKNRENDQANSFII